MNSIDDYIQELIESGCYTEKLRPIKCIYCGSRDFKDVDEHYGPFGLEEFFVKCKKCGEIIGHWAYGGWEIPGM